MVFLRLNFYPRMSTIHLSATRYTHLESPLGRLLLTSREGKLSGLYFADQPHARIGPDWVREDDNGLFAQTARQLEEYASGARKIFDLSQVGLRGSIFQTRIWLEIAKIPFGQTITYGELALRVGRSTKDARAVGTATGLNPISWIIPCHRVVGKSGALTGYAGGLARKRALLEFEAARSAEREAILAHHEEQPALVLGPVHAKRWVALPGICLPGEATKPGHTLCGLDRFRQRSQAGKERQPFGRGSQGRGSGVAHSVK